MLTQGTLIAPGPVLLDTCAALWFMGKAPISEISRNTIQAAGASGKGVYVSPFSAWEIGMLVAKGRIQLSLEPQIWFNTLLAKPGVRLAPLTPEILLNSTALPGVLPNDPADRIIASTARTHGYWVITRDRPLLNYAQQGHIQAIAC